MEEMLWRYRKVSFTQRTHTHIRKHHCHQPEGSTESWRGEHSRSQIKQLCSPPSPVLLFEVCVCVCVDACVCAGLSQGNNNAMWPTGGSVSEHPLYALYNQNVILNAPSRLYLLLCLKAMLMFLFLYWGRYGHVGHTSLFVFHGDPRPVALLPVAEENPLTCLNRTHFWHVWLLLIFSNELWTDGWTVQFRSADNVKR